MLQGDPEGATRGCSHIKGCCRRYRAAGEAAHASAHGWELPFLLCGKMSTFLNFPVSACFTAIEGVLGAASSPVLLTSSMFIALV